MNLAQAIEERETARIAAINAAGAMATAKTAYALAKHTLEEATVAHEKANRRFVAAVTALHPLLDADVAGIVGKRTAQELSTEAQPEAAAE
jgi:hypothetical protein